MHIYKCLGHVQLPFSLHFPHDLSTLLPNFLPSPSRTDSSWASHAPVDGCTPMSVII